MNLLHLQVLHESEVLELRGSNSVSQTLSLGLEKILSDSLSPEILGCPDDEAVVNTSMITSCLSTLDSRYLYVITSATSYCRYSTELYQDSTWKATVNMITEEIEFEDLCGLT